MSASVVVCTLCCCCCSCSCCCCCCCCVVSLCVCLYAVIHVRRSVSLRILSNMWVVVVVSSVQILSSFNTPTSDQFLHLAQHSPMPTGHSPPGSGSPPDSPMSPGNYDPEGASPDSPHGFDIERTMRYVSLLVSISS